MEESWKIGFSDAETKEEKVIVNKEKGRKK
jgi:hypothetical protein